MNVQVAVQKNVRLVEAAESICKRPALDGLIAASNGLNNFLESNAVYVLSGVRPIGESAVVLDRDGRSTLIVTPAWDGERAAVAFVDRPDGRDRRSRCRRLQAPSRQIHRLDVARTISVGLSLLGSRPGRAHRGGAGRLPQAGRRTGARSCARAHRRGAQGGGARDLDRRARLRAACSNSRVPACANTSSRPSFIASPKNSAPRTIFC